MESAMDEGESAMDEVVMLTGLLVSITTYLAVQEDRDRWHLAVCPAGPMAAIQEDIRPSCAA